MRRDTVGRGLESVSSGDRATSAAPGDIILVRHGRPNLNRHVWLTAAEWERWWADYDRAGLAPGDAPPEDLLQEARDARHLFSSPLKRATATAKLAYEGRDFTQDPVFSEAPLPRPPAPSWIKLTPWAWGTISRICWWLGYSGGGESHKLARARAEQAAELLAVAVSGGEAAVCCGHGWFNRMIRGRLRAMGWACVYDGGDRYWSRRRFVFRR